MNKYGPRATQEIRNALHKYEKGELHSGQAEQPVASRKQAIAIGIEKARDKGYKVPKQSS